ncbi:hypothetical protein E6C27_scaffold133G001200 [Cucumis melo var. makuwa]|uniref:Uncharacterized protein n=1 Tax=Cucumis melo var. makuwa TaxID=1194695 RepID=A0A5A7U2F7_CUCMM|nr:hypothetical protein E6C27_scaffold133G001200 [Cucumis melo var. makuwa]
MEEHISTKRVGNLFIVEKRLYPFKGNMPEFLMPLIRALKWKRFFQGVNMKMPDMFYNGYINTRRHPRGAKSFLLLIEQLCIKACPELEKSPQVEKTLKPLNTIPIDQSKLPSPKTLNQDVFHESFSDPIVFMEDATKEFEEGGKRKEVLEEAIDDPL